MGPGIADYGGGREVGVDVAFIATFVVAEAVLACDYFEALVVGD